MQSVTVAQTPMTTAAVPVTPRGVVNAGEARDNAVGWCRSPAYAVFVLMGLTTSSIGVSYLRADPNNRSASRSARPSPVARTS